MHSSFNVSVTWWYQVTRTQKVWPWPDTISLRPSINFSKLHGRLSGRRAVRIFPQEKYSSLSRINFFKLDTRRIWMGSFTLRPLYLRENGPRWLVDRKLWRSRNDVDDRSRGTQLSSEGSQPRSNWPSGYNHLPVLTELPSSLNSSANCAAFNHLKIWNWSE